MKHTNYFAEFANVYSKVYNDIIKMMQEKGSNRLELEQDEDYPYEIRIHSDDFCEAERRFIPSVIEIVNGVLWIENEEEDCYEVIFSVLGTEIVSLYELVYSTLYVEN